MSRNRRRNKKRKVWCTVLDGDERRGRGDEKKERGWEEVREEKGGASEEEDGKNKNKMSEGAENELNKHTSR